MHSFTDKAVNDLANAPGVFTREGVLFWSDGPSETASSFPAKLVTSDGAHPVTCWAPEPFLADPDKIFKVQATVFASPSYRPEAKAVAALSPRSTEWLSHDHSVPTLPYRIRRGTTSRANHGHRHRWRRWCNPGGL